jgi:hypothetical protein
MKNIKLTYPAVLNYLEKQTPGLLGRWGDYQFHINEDIDQCDYWVVYNGLLKSSEHVKCPRSNTIFVTGEPRTVCHYNKKLLDQFSHVISVQDNIRHPGLHKTLQITNWHVGIFMPGERGPYSKNYDELIATKEIKKSKTLSIISSNKLGTSGHRKRYRFVVDLKKYFGNEVDLFGSGINDFKDKWEVLEPYRYSVAIENCSIDDYVTEKLFDCYLAHTFPIYYGAPNIGKYLPSESFLPININHLEESIKSIKKIIEDPDHYNQHLKYVMGAKIKYLNQYSFFPMIVNFIETKLNNPGGIKEEITIKDYGHRSVTNFLGNFLGSELKGNIKKHLLKK